MFFEWDKSDITPEAGSILDNAVTQYQICGNAQVMLAGHADKSGSHQYNVGLSQRRADAVKAYLASRAIPEGVISTEAFGESRRASTPPMASAKCRTVAWKSPTVRVRASKFSRFGDTDWGGRREPASLFRCGDGGTDRLGRMTGRG